MARFRVSVSVRLGARFTVGVGLEVMVTVPVPHIRQLCHPHRLQRSALSAFVPGSRSAFSRIQARHSPAGYRCFSIAPDMS